MAGARGEVQEEGPIGIDRAEIADELDRPIGQIGRQVVAVLDRAVRRHGVAVVVEGRDELVGLATVEAVPAVEAAGEGPRVPARAEVCLVLGGEVPLADRVRGVPVVTEDLGEEPVLPRGPSPVPRETHRQLRHPPHPAAVVVPAREQTGARRRAQRRGAEVRQPHALGGETVHHGRGDVRAVTAELGEANVVEDDQHHVRRAGRRCRVGRPPRDRAPPVPSDPPRLPVALHLHLPFARPGQHGIRSPRGRVDTSRRYGGTDFRCTSHDAPPERLTPPGKGRSGMPESDSPERRAALHDAFVEVRQATERLAAPLSPEDQTVQSMPDVSPTKWHRAHTSWFFETFLLETSLRGYQAFDPAYAYLFNSYYETVGARYPRAQRGLVSRPGVGEVGKYRSYVDEAMEHLLGASTTEEQGWLVELGLHHEQQHQELVLMDIKHVLSCNPLLPTYVPATERRPSASDLLSALPASLERSAEMWIEHPGGLVEIGHHGPAFSF